MVWKSSKDTVWILNNNRRGIGIPIIDCIKANMKIYLGDGISFLKRVWNREKIDGGAAKR